MARLAHDAVEGDASRGQIPGEQIRQGKREVRGRAAAVLGALGDLDLVVRQGTAGDHPHQGLGSAFLVIVRVADDIAEEIVPAGPEIAVRGEVDIPVGQEIRIAAQGVDDLHPFRGIVGEEARPRDHEARGAGVEGQDHPILRRLGRCQRRLEGLEAQLIDTKARGPHGIDHQAQHLGTRRQGDHLGSAEPSEASPRVGDGDGKAQGADADDLQMDLAAAPGAGGAQVEEIIPGRRHRHAVLQELARSHGADEGRGSAGVEHQIRSFVAGAGPAVAAGVTGLRILVADAVAPQVESLCFEDPRDGGRRSAIRGPGESRSRPGLDPEIIDPDALGSAAAVEVHMEAGVSDVDTVGEGAAPGRVRRQPGAIEHLPPN